MSLIFYENNKQVCSTASYLHSVFTLTNTMRSITLYGSDNKQVCSANVTPVNNKIEEAVSIDFVAKAVFCWKIRIDDEPESLSYTAKQRPYA